MSDLESLLDFHLTSKSLIDLSFHSRLGFKTLPSDYGIAGISVTAGTSTCDQRHSVRSSVGAMFLAEGHRLSDGSARCRREHNRLRAFTQTH
jgi:hypothetical protein